jgi:hypothetical protein
MILRKGQEMLHGKGPRILPFHDQVPDDSPHLTPAAQLAPCLNVGRNLLCKTEASQTLT